MATSEKILDIFILFSLISSSSNYRRAWHTLRLQMSYAVITAISSKYLALPSINALLKLVSVLIKHFLERKY